jgi:hypothetical protein
MAMLAVLVGRLALDPTFNEDASKLVPLTLKQKHSFASYGFRQATLPKHSTYHIASATS